ncbi:hypothetical protein HZC53_04420 [Candidatus Uhrbacteria bacterium]|nr:hypothetical protein [Candidatus Uhrbacteria bacterium]
MDQYRTNPWLLVSVALISALAGGIAIFLWKSQPDPSPLQSPTVSQAQPPSTTETTTSSDVGAYRNEKFGLSLTLPEGYRAVEHEKQIDIVKKPTPQDETPMPEMTIGVYWDELENYGLSRGEIIKNKENVEYNGVKGIKFITELIYDKTTALCDSYRFAGTDNRIYEFRLWECLDSPIFDQVVKSIKLLK